MEDIIVAPTYKLHGIRDGGRHTKEMPATSDVLTLVAQTAQLTSEGYAVAVYVLQKVV